MYYCQSFYTLIRDYGTIGYIVSNRLARDRVVDQIGSIFLSGVSRTPQSIDAIVDKILPIFNDVDRETLIRDVAEFYDSFVDAGFLIKGESAEECKAKEKVFSYTTSEFATPRGDKGGWRVNIMDSTQVFLERFYEKNPSLNAIQVELTSKCNERCIHCYIPHEYKITEMPFELYKSILMQMSEMKALYLTLSGGEPMLHPRFLECLKEAQKYDFSIEILSNLTLLTDEIIEVLKDTRLNSIQTSLYSMNPKHHDAITTIKGSFHKTMDSIEKLIANDIPLEISCPTMGINKDDYKDVLEWGDKHKIRVGTDCIMMAKYNHDATNLQTRLTLEEVTKVLSADMEFSSKFQSSVYKASHKEELREYLCNPDRRLCGAGRNSACITANGNLCPCAGWQQLVCGNVKEKPLKEIWENSNELKYVRSITFKDLNNGKCLNCENALYCAPCLVRNANESPSNNPLEVNKHFCDVAAINKKLVEDWRRKNSNG